jgi:hypothetical protein
LQAAREHSEPSVRTVQRREELRPSSTTTSKNFFPSAAGRENFESEQCNRVMQNLLEIILRSTTLRPLRTAELCSALLRSVALRRISSNFNQTKKKKKEHKKNLKNLVFFFPQLSAGPV